MSPSGPAATGPAPASRERSRSAAVLVASALVLAAMAWPMLRGRVYVADDLGAFSLPLRSYYADCLRSGDDPRWCPRLFCGFDLHGEGQVGLLHPWHLALYRALPLGAAFDLEFLANYPVLFAGTALFLRRRGLPRDAALFGALTFTFSGFSLLHAVHLNAIAVVSHIPWLLWAEDIVLRDRDPRRVAWAKFATVLLTASQILLGYPQYVCFSMAAEAMFALGVAASSRDPRRLAPLVEAKVLGLLTGGIQLLPTRDALARSSRGAPSPSYLAQGSLHPANLLPGLAPYLFRGLTYPDPSMPVPAHEYGFYDGSATPVLLAWLFLRRKALGPWGPLARAAALLGVSATVLALGEHGPLPDLGAWPPWISPFRFSARWIVLAHLAASLLGAIALADLAASPRLAERRPPWVLTLPLAAGLVLAAGAVVLRRVWPESLAAAEIAPIGPVMAGPILSALATAAVVAASRGVRPALVGLILLAAADQAAFGLSYLGRVPTRTLADLAATRPVPSGSSGLRVGTPGPDDLWLVNGVSLVEGYAGLVPSRQLPYASAGALRLAGARWRLRDAPLGPWEPIPDPMPRARLVSLAVRSSFAGAVLDRHDLRTTALVPLDLALPESPPGESSIVADRPGSIEVSTAAPTRQLLVLTESYHPGWRALVDGRPASTLPVYGDFLGCVVDAGRHAVSFRFAPRSYLLSAWCSSAGLTLALLSLARSLRKSRGRVRRERTRSPENLPISNILS